MSNVKVIAYSIDEDEVYREAALDYINYELNECTTHDVWLRGIEVKDHQFEGGGYLDDDEVKVIFTRHDNLGLYRVMFKKETTKEMLVIISISIEKLEELLNEAV